MILMAEDNESNYKLVGLSVLRKDYKLIHV